MNGHENFETDLRNVMTLSLDKSTNSTFFNTASGRPFLPTSIEVNRARNFTFDSVYESIDFIKSQIAHCNVIENTWKESTNSIKVVIFFTFRDLHRLEEAATRLKWRAGEESAAPICTSCVELQGLTFLFLLQKNRARCA